MRAQRQWCLGALACWVCGLGLSFEAIGQLVPDRLYYGVGRPMPMTVLVDRAAASHPGATLEIRLVRPVTFEVVGTATVEPGPVDLGGLFPRLWALPAAEPRGAGADDLAGGARPSVLYAQLVRVTGERVEGVGPAVVLQPMVTPSRAVLDQRNPARPQVVFRRADPGEPEVFSGYRAYIDRHVILQTEHGPIRLALRPDAAPNTAWNFRHLVEGGFYTDVEFHRVVSTGRPGEGFVIQAGDPTGTGHGGPGYEIALEPSPIPHEFGVVSMARQRDPNSAGSQFFIALSRADTARLDGLYCPFAQVVDGAEVIAAIARSPVEPGPSFRPRTPPRILRADLVDAPPVGEGPAPVKPIGEGPVER